MRRIRFSPLPALIFGGLGGWFLWRCSHALLAPFAQGLPALGR
jgi:hypothetical protein